MLFIKSERQPAELITEGFHGIFHCVMGLSSLHCWRLRMITDHGWSLDVNEAIQSSLNLKNAIHRSNVIPRAPLHLKCPSMNII